MASESWDFQIQVPLKNDNTLTEDKNIWWTWKHLLHSPNPDDCNSATLFWLSLTYLCRRWLVENAGCSGIKFISRMMSTFLGRKKRLWRNLAIVGNSYWLRTHSVKASKLCTVSNEFCQVMTTVTAQDSTNEFAWFIDWALEWFSGPIEPRTTRVKLCLFVRVNSRVLNQEILLNYLKFMCRLNLQQ